MVSGGLAPKLSSSLHSRWIAVADLVPGPPVLTLADAGHGVGPHTAATLLVTVGDNPERLRNEATFARLCGVAPIPAGSGKTDGYHRLQRGGDRQANSALWTIVLSRMATHPETRAYVERRAKEGKQTRFIMRCLKRHVAREIFKLLPRPEQALTT
ncbi:hypothetical protein BH20ACT8_BH20ACT8_10480 [soil metagenome]